MSSDNTNSSSKTNSIDTNIFVYAVLIVSVFIAGILIANAVYFRKISNGLVENVSMPKAQAKNMYILNLLLLIPVGAVMIYAVVKIILGAKRYEDLKSTAVVKYGKAKSWATKNPYGFIPATSGPNVSFNGASDASGNLAALSEGS